jgi:hypothetical protein
MYSQCHGLAKIGLTHLKYQVCQRRAYETWKPNSQRLEWFPKESTHRAEARRKKKMASPKCESGIGYSPLGIVPSSNILLYLT